MRQRFLIWRGETCKALFRRILSRCGAARDLGPFAIKRTFLLDSAALQSALRSIDQFLPDALEVLPAMAAPHIVTKLHAEHPRVPVIAGGLVSTLREIEDLLQRTEGAAYFKAKVACAGVNKAGRGTSIAAMPVDQADMRLADFQSLFYELVQRPAPDDVTWMITVLGNVSDCRPVHWVTVRMPAPVAQTVAQYEPFGSIVARFR